MIMKSLVIFTALFAAAIAASISKKAPLLGDNSPSAIDDEYIVIFQDNVAEETVRQHHSWLNNITLQGTPKNKVMFHYHIGSFRGYSVKMHESMLDIVRGMEEVKYVERNQVVKALYESPCEIQRDATWGLMRTTREDLPNDNDYSYNSTKGNGVDVYIIDTGIHTNHPDFGGRAKWGADFVDNPSPGDDLNGHGTHCAGTVMADDWGLARSATAIAVRVLNANGSGTTAGVISGIQYVADQHTREKKSVANMSLGGGKSTTLNSAVDAAVDAGVHFAIAAGNEAQDACNVSPASAEKGVTVAASDRSDKLASFSNYGTCVDIIGPGVDITSTWNNGGINTISGTSMAAPHVAGIIAEYLTTNDVTPSQMKALLTEKATKGKITGLDDNPTKARTPNELVFFDCGGGNEGEN